MRKFLLIFVFSNFNSGVERRAKRKLDLLEEDPDFEENIDSFDIK
jgi:hypothetical protein